MKINDRTRKILFGVAVVISFSAIYIYNCLTPIMSDDLLFDAGAYHSVTDIIRAGYENYMNWNGRTVVQLIMRGCLLLVLFFLGSGYVKSRTLKGWMLAGPAGMFTGLGFMVMAPGNRIRSAVVMEEEEHQGILALAGRLLKINQAARQYLLLLGAVVIFLVVYLLLKGWVIRRMMNALVFAAAGIATAYALILTAPPMDRAYFGAGIFMVIACVQAIAYIPREEKGLSALKYGGIIVFCIDMFFVYCGNGANLARILREVNERERYILEQKAQGNYDLTVPMLRPEFRTKYSFLYQNDVEEDPESWGSTIYGEYYGLNSLTGVPRAEWTAY